MQPESNISGWVLPTIVVHNVPSGLHSGATFELDVAAAIRAGVLKQTPRPILIGDLKNGDVFKFKKIWDTDWKNSAFRMVNAGGAQNSVTVYGPHNRSVHFFNFTKDTQFAVLQPDGTWKEAI